jgi:hypothetical protein
MAVQKPPQDSAAKKKRGRPFGTTRVPRVKAVRYKPSGPLKKIKPKLLPDLFDAFCYLPHDKQKTLIGEYLTYLPLVPETIYGRAYRYKSKRRTISQMPEEEIYRLIDDVAIATRDSITEWVLMPNLNQVANALMHSIKSTKHKRTGQRITTLDRVEFFAITLSMTTNLFSKYLTVLTREGVIEKGLEPASLDAIANATIAMDALIKDGIFNRICSAWKANGGIKDSKDTTRKKANMDKVVDNMENVEKDIEFFANELAKKQAKLLSKINRTTNAAHDATRVKSPRGRKPKAK